MSNEKTHQLIIDLSTFLSTKCAPNPANFDHETGEVSQEFSLEAARLGDEIGKYVERFRSAMEKAPGAMSHADAIRGLQDESDRYFKLWQEEMARNAKVDRGVLLPHNAKRGDEFYEKGLEHGPSAAMAAKPFSSRQPISCQSGDWDGLENL